MADDDEAEPANAVETSSKSVQFLPPPTETGKDDDGDQQQHQSAAAAPTPAASATAECPSNLRILICTGNFGNAKPTLECAEALVPRNGSVDLVLASPSCPLPEGVDGPTDADLGGNFDIIVIGAQEAVFTSKSSSSVGGADSPGRRGSRRDSGDSRRESDDSRYSSEPRLSVVRENSSHGGGGGDDGDGDKDPKSDRSGMSSQDDAEFSPDDDGGGRRSDRSAGNATTTGGDTIRRATNALAVPLRAVGTATTDKVLKPVAATIVSAAGSTDHNKNARGKRAPLPGVGKSTGASWVGGTKELTEMFWDVIGPGYESVVRFQRGEMRLVVLVRDEVLPFVEEVDVFAENTGIAGVVANKGGIIATLNVGGRKRISFLTSHLEAHEGKEHYKQRCANLAEIFSGAKNGATARFDASVTSHHMFVCGDLNFRVALPPPEGEEKWEGEAHRKVVRGMVEREEWEALNDADELRGALEKGDCLAGFETLPCHFNPTFKVERKAGFNYQDKRTPSYTDRILWKSAHGLGGAIRPLVYEPVAGFVTSDHKPVRGAFSVAMDSKEPEGRGRRESRRPKLSPSISERNLHIFVSDMRCTDLYQVKEVIRESSSPYIMFVTDPKDLLRLRRSKRQMVLDKMGCGGYAKKFEPKHGASKIREGWPRTRAHKKEGRNPDWGDAEVQLKVCKPGIHCAEDLAGAMLYMAVYAKQGMSANVDDVLVGTVALNLQELAKEKKTNLGASLAVGNQKNQKNSASVAFDIIDIDEEPILKNGVERGRLSCSIVAWWVNPDLEGSAFSSRRSTRNMKKSIGKNVWPCVIS